MTGRMALEPKASMLVYLDHSILNQMVKGQSKLREVFAANNMQVVYSHANLDEIANSKDKEQEFLSLLDALGARYLRLVRDDKFRLTDRAEIETVAPAATFAAYLRNRQESSAGDFGLSDILQKFYGGRVNMTFGDIAYSGQEEFDRLLDTLVQEIESGQFPSEFNAEAFLRALPETKRVFAAISAEMGWMLDADASQNQVRAIDSELGVGPKYLNNLKGPGILKQIWTRVAAKIPEGAISFDEFFGLVRPRWATDDRPITKLEQINSIYHQLNFLGYWQDENMQRNRSFNGHLKDLTHVGMAS